MYTAETLWESSWPGVEFSEASPKDRIMFENHADSINMYFETVVGVDGIEQED